MLEEESDARRFSIHCLAHYCLDLAEMTKTSRMAPVVIFLRRAGEVPQRLRLGGDHHTYLGFFYLSCALGDLPYEQHRDSDNLVARLNLPNMSYPPEHKVTVYAQAVRGLIALEPDPEKRLKYLDFIDLYAALEDNERARYQRDYPSGDQDHEPICRTLSRGEYATRHGARPAAERNPGSKTIAAAPERRHFLRNPKWGPSDFGCKKSGDGHGLRRPAFVLRPSRRALRAAPGLPQ